MKRQPSRLAALTVVAVALVLWSTRPARAAGPATRPAADRATLEKQFAELLTNATLVGEFSASDKPGAAPHEDRYHIVKAVKGDGDNWTITAKVEYKGFGVPVDLTAAVLWADDTPVLELTDKAIPTLGTFTARVMFFRDQYAGMWRGANHGGLMWGRVEHDAAGGKGPATKPAS